MRRFGKTVRFMRTGFSEFELTGIMHRDPNLEIDEGQFTSIFFRANDFVNAPFSASVILTFTQPPNNGNTITIAGVVYTFRATINNATPREVWRNNTGAVAASNFTAAVNAGAGSGTAYSSATTAHPTCTAAVVVSGQVRVSLIAAGPTNLTASESAYGVTLSATEFQGGTPRAGDTLVIDGVTWSVMDQGFDSEGAVECRIKKVDG
jgi:hypothetical protein